MNNETIFTLTYINLFIKRDSLDHIIDYIIKEEVFKYNFEITEWDLFGSIKRQISSSDIFKNEYFRSKLQEKISKLKDDIIFNNSHITRMTEVIKNLNEESNKIENKIEILQELMND